MFKSDYKDPLPPPYTEQMQQTQSTAAQVPTYQTPSYNQSFDGSTTLQSATTKFPPTMNGYFTWKLTSTFYMGPSNEERLFAVTTHSNVFSSKPSVVLYNGPTDKHPTLATFKADKWGRTRPGTISLPGSSGTSYAHDIEELMTPSSSSHHTSSVWSFEAPIGGKTGTRQRFEWRSTHGTEIKQLATGHSYGWKLVRIAGPASNSSAGGRRKERDLGYTSDGLEIVAILAHNASWSMTKGFRFAFMGTGLTGTLGEIWEIMTLISALQLWYWDEQKAAASTAAVAASS